MNHHVQYICRQLSDIHAVLDRTTAKCRAMLPKDVAFVASYEFCTIPKLPPEILDLVFGCLERQDLVNVVLTSSTFKSVALRLLYHTITVSDAVQSVYLLRTLVKNPTLAGLVRSLELDWSQSIRNPTRNLHILLQKAVRNLVSLHSLTLDISKSCVWILDKCPFSLRFFSTTFRCDHHLSAFLNHQPEITELCLRGVPDTPLGLFMLGEDEQANTEPSFALLPTSLPKLAHLRAIHSGPRTIEMMIQGRPITGASIPLYYWNGRASLDALATSTMDIKRLNLMSFDHDAPKWVLKEVAMRFPKLEALHVVVLLASCEQVSVGYFVFLMLADPASDHAGRNLGRLVRV